MSYVRNWVFTINNYTFEDILAVIDLDGYWFFGFEVGAKGTPHIQGFCHFNRQRSRTYMKKCLPRAWFQPMKGSFKSNYDYCSADGDFYEHEGYPKPEQGKRSDLDDIADLVVRQPLKDVSRLYPSQFIRYSKGIVAYKALHQEHRTEKPYVEWLYGPTGCGKTMYAADYRPESYYVKDGTMWWDGYEQQDVVIIDDFDGNWPFRDLLRLLDRYPYQGQVKGGYVKINSPFIFITCDRTPDDLYDGQKTDHELSQLLRRIDKVTLVKKNV